MTGSTKRPPEPGSPQPTGSMDLRIDGVPATVPPGSTVLEACDLAGRYVPRLCTYPEQHCCASCAAGARASSACGPTGAVAAGSGVAPTDAAASAVASVDTECGLCVVRVGDGMVVLACATQAEAGTEIVTDDEGLRRLRLGRLGEILQGHPFVCLLCPDRDGCQRDECSYGNPPEARCCDLYGECELAALVAYVDAEGTLHPSTGPFDREAVTEGPIRREPGLCVGCGRCVVVCEGIEGAGQALRMVAAGPGGRPVAVPKGASLRAAGCTFCGRCVLVCPSGALMAPGDAGARWLERRRLTSGLADPILPPRRRLTVDEARDGVGSTPGVLQLLDERAEVLLIVGLPDMAQGLEQALGELGAETVAYVLADVEMMYTQRESELLTLYARRHGRLPRGNDLGDDLYDDEDC